MFKKYFYILLRFFRQLVYKFHKYFFYFHYKKITELLIPNILGIEKLKLGKEGDGTYILPSGIIENDVYLLSFGIADDISFEEDFSLLYPNSKIFAYDPTIPELPSTNANINFSKVGIAGYPSKKRKLVTFSNIIAKQKIDIKKQIIVKMDVEGWEWGILERLKFCHYNLPVIAIEFHMMTTTSTFQILYYPYIFWRRLKIMQKMLKEYYILHLHVNNAEYSFFKDFSFPWLFEITFVHKSCFVNSIKADVKKFNTITWKDKKDIQFPFFKNMNNHEL